MKRIETALPGVLILEPLVHGDLFVLGALIHVVFWSAVTEVRHGRVRIRSGLLGMRVRELTVEEVTGTTASSSIQSGNKRYYTVKMALRRGSVTVAGMIEGKHRAEQLRTILGQALEGRFD